MESAKQFENLTWANLTIIDDELKTVREFDVKSLKYRDLWIVCSQLKIKGVKNSTKEQMIKKLASLHQIETKCDKIADISDHDEVLGKLHYINFKKILPHDWKNLE